MSDPVDDPMQVSGRENDLALRSADVGVA
jgi:hypothetical protein